MRRGQDKPVNEGRGVYKRPFYGVALDSLFPDQDGKYAPNTGSGKSQRQPEQKMAPDTRAMRLPASQKKRNAEANQAETDDLIEVDRSISINIKDNRHRRRQGNEQGRDRDGNVHE